MKDKLYLPIIFIDVFILQNIDLIYVKGDGKGLNFNEPSRYIRQVEKELRVLKNIRINNYKMKIEK